MTFDGEKIRMLTEKLRAFNSRLDADEQVLLAAMLRLAGLAMEERLPVKNPPATGEPDALRASSDVSKAFEDALTIGTGSTLVTSRAELSREITIDVPPTSIGVGGIVNVSTTIDPDPVTIRVP